ncbi:VOC family protein [Cohnella sp. CFH 77786]|uniref:VOC family protein n=1 Tax=Cohnella sp. CFH 77786 TaxID=2662265 RepID=UPI001C609D7F|nr:VOC family protein [Cohnella sp. CFH 77786]
MLTTTGLSHVALHAKDPKSLSEFYNRVLGLETVGYSPNWTATFLRSRASEENHELAFVASAQIAHFAFKAATLGELKQLYAELTAAGIIVRATQIQAGSVAIFFADPEDNLIEVHWPTPLADRKPPFIHPVDLAKTEEEIMEILRQVNQ